MPARPNNGNALSFNKSFPGNCYTSSSSSNQVYFLFENNPLNGTIAIFRISRQTESSRFKGNGTYVCMYVHSTQTYVSIAVLSPRSFKIQRWCKRKEMFSCQLRSWLQKRIEQKIANPKCQISAVVESKNRIKSRPHHHIFFPARSLFLHRSLIGDAFARIITSSINIYFIE